MKTQDRATLVEWLDQDLDGQLGSAEQTRLAERLAADPELAAERRQLESLHGLLRATRVAVRPRFREQVMAALPVAAWQPGRVAAWALPLAMMVALAVAAVWVLGTGTTSDGPIVGTAAAVVDFLKVTALAGAGLLAASWRGVGLGLEELIASSSLGLVAMAALVLAMNVLFFSMLRRRRPHDVQPVLERAGTDPGDSATQDAD